LLYSELSHPKGIWFGQFIQWALSIIVVSTFPILILRVGVGLCLIIYGCTMPAAVIMISFMLVETKGKRFDEINSEIHKTNKVII
jgi:hypothetical protein